MRKMRNFSTSNPRIPMAPPIMYNSNLIKCMDLEAIIMIPRVPLRNIMVSGKIINAMA